MGIIRGGGGGGLMAQISLTARALFAQRDSSRYGQIEQIGSSYGKKCLCVVVETYVREREK